MTINGKRDFTYNGKKYHKTDLPKADRVDDKKYFISFVDANGIYKPAYCNIGWELEKFKTIKEAQRYVRDWDWTLDTLY